MDFHAGLAGARWMGLPGRYATRGGDVMSLITRCPKCQSGFEVTADQLRLHDGLVRCGQCSHVFDGFKCLQAELPTLTRKVDQEGSSPPAGVASSRASTSFSPDLSGTSSSAPSRESSRPSSSDGPGYADSGTTPPVSPMTSSSMRAPAPVAAQNPQGSGKSTLPRQATLRASVEQTDGTATSVSSD